MPDINIGAITEALNDKVDLDSSWGEPSTTYDDLTLGASGTTYTAPADGYVKVFINFSTSNNRIQAKGYNVDDVGFCMRSYGTGWIGDYFCVKKGLQFEVSYTGTVEGSLFRFYYAQKTN